MKAPRCGEEMMCLEGGGRLLVVVAIPSALELIVPTRALPGGRCCRDGRRSGAHGRGRCGCGLLRIEASGGGGLPRGAAIFGALFHIGGGGVFVEHDFAGDNMAVLLRFLGGHRTEERERRATD